MDVWFWGCDSFSRTGLSYSLGAIYVVYVMADSLTIQMTNDLGGCWCYTLRSSAILLCLAAGPDAEFSSDDRQAWYPYPITVEPLVEKSVHVNRKHKLYSLQKKKND